MKTHKKILSRRQAGSLVVQHRRTVLNVSGYDLTLESEYNLHSQLVKQIGNNYMLREFSDFTVDEHNQKVLRFLLYYFNGCRLAENVFSGEKYKIYKNLLLIGNSGTGKTLLMQVFADYLKLTGNPHWFFNTSVPELLNYYKINGHIDRFTYREMESPDASPFPICLNDIGMDLEKQKSYGTSLHTVIDEFMYARYEIFQFHGKKYHLTSNLDVKDFKSRFGDRLMDRFKTFNVVSLSGNSRRT